MRPQFTRLIMSRLLFRPTPMRGAFMHFLLNLAFASIPCRFPIARGPCALAVREFPSPATLSHCIFIVRLEDRHGLHLDEEVGPAQNGLNARGCGKGI